MQMIWSVTLVFFLILLSFLPLFSNSIFKASNHFSSSHVLSFDHPQFSTISMQNTSFVSVTINDCMLTSVPGKAELPFYSTHILIPDGCSIQDITVTPTDYVDYSEIVQTRHILPSQEESPFSSQKTFESLQLNQSWYQQDSFFPSDLLSSHGISYMKGYPVETVHIFPLKYNPLNHQLRFYEELEITITFSNDDSPMDNSSNQFFRKKDNDADAVKDLVLNPDLVDTYSTDDDEETDGMSILGSSEPIAPLDDSYAGGLCNSSEDVDYVIVTSEELTLTTGQSYSWDDLLSHRFQTDGLSGSIVTMEEILDCTDYCSEIAVFNDSAARLREFCKDAYLDWNTEYILLGGSWETGNSDRQIVPCRIFKDREETYSVKTMPSDLYFSNLDGDWYYDSEGIWGGGRNGANDKLSELSVGRIPVWNLEMVSNAVQKIIWYDNCNDESFLRSAGFLGGDLGWDITSKQYMEEIRQGDGEWAQYIGFEEWNTNFPSYTLDTTGRYYEADYASEHDAIQAWTTAINNNELCLISHLDHGSRTNTLSIDDGSSLSNDHYFLGTSQACLSGCYSDGTSGASTFLSTWDDRGAFAMILNTGYGYGSSSSTRGKSQLQHKIFWNYFFENQTTDFDNWRLGKAMQYTKDVFSSNIDLYHVYTYVWYSWNLFGDPAQQIRINERLNNPPVIESITIDDDAQNVSVDLSLLSVNISDEDSDLLNWSIETSPNIGSNSSQNDFPGQKNCSLSNLSYFTEYTWYLNVSDGSFWLNEAYTFTTGPDPTNQVPVLSNPLPSNQSDDIDVWTNQVSVLLNDSTGDLCSYTIQGVYLNDISNQTLANTTINTSCLTPLPFDTEIRWFVNLTDSRSYPLSYCFNFTTREQFNPSVPTNFSVDSLNRTALQLNWTKNHSADNTIIERNNVSTWNRGEGIMVYNGTKNTIIDQSLNPGTTYYYQIWGYNTTDQIHSLNSTYANATTMNNHPVFCSQPNPTNNAINCSLNITWSINLSDADNDSFNWTISCNETLQNSSTLDTNGTKTLLLTNLSFYTEYTIWVNATDGFNTTNQSFNFRTKLPNDTQKPKINSITLSSIHTTPESLAGWNQLQCNISDNFRLKSVTLNITSNQNTSENLSLTQTEQSNTWIVQPENLITKNMSLILYATDLNGNCNQSNISLFSITSMLGSSNQNIDYTDVPIDVSTISFTVSQALNQTMNYTILTSPDMGSKIGNITGNETILHSFSDLSYHTAYECQFSVFPGEMSNASHPNLSFSFVTTVLFTTESAPQQPSQDSSPPSGGGMSPPPLPPVEPEEEVNLPPEQPLPPQGSTNIMIGTSATYIVSSWDKNNHQIRFKIDWGDNNLSQWSDYVSSNESKHFTHRYITRGNYTIKVIVQDKEGLNSTWSQPLSIQVINPQINPNEKEDQSEVEIKVNNETGETSFKYNTTTSNHSTASIVWDFGDGTIVQGNSPKHSYEKPGEYNVKITIADEHGNVTMKTYTVTITEPQQQIDETPLDESGSKQSSFPWIMILVGIFASVISVFLAIFYLERN